MLSQVGCCIQDAAAAAMAAPPKFPEAKSRGLLDLYLLFSFPKGEPNRVFCSIWVLLDNPNKCCRRAFCQKSASLCPSCLENETIARKFGLLLVIFTSRSTTWTALAPFTFFGTFALAIRPWIAPFCLTCILWVRIALHSCWKLHHTIQQAA